MIECPIQPGETWKLVVKGRPVPQGDLSAMPIINRKTRQPVIGKGGRPVINMVHSNAETLKPWRQEIAQAAVAAGWPGLGIAALDEAVFLRLRFFFKRPEGHYGTGRNAGVLKDSAPLYPEQSGGDLDKLTRAVMDALTEIVWKDDKRVVVLEPRRRFGTPERVEISVRRPRIRTVGELRALRDLNPLHAEQLDAELQLDLFNAVEDMTAQVAA